MLLLHSDFGIVVVCLGLRLLIKKPLVLNNSYFDLAIFSPALFISLVLFFVHGVFFLCVFALIAAYFMFIISKKEITILNMRRNNILPCISESLRAQEIEFEEDKHSIAINSSNIKIVIKGNLFKCWNTVRFVKMDSRDENNIIFMEIIKSLKQVPFNEFPVGGVSLLIIGICLILLGIRLYLNW